MSVFVADPEEFEERGIVRSPSGISYNTAETMQPDDPMRFAYDRLRIAFSFLEDDDGVSFLDGTYDPDAMHDGPDPDSISILSSPHPLYRTPTNMSTVSVDSVASRFFRKSASRDERDKVTLSLAWFCNLIARHDTLSAARILSVECYPERTSIGILHRFLIFHVRRPQRPDVWLRVDRRREGKSSLLKTAMAGGRTAANDTVQLSDMRLHLLRSGYKPSNVLKFGDPPNLGTFRKFLLVICEELQHYQVWPENCWFLCSLLQEHLSEAGDGSFEVGGLIHPKLGNGVRARINYRLAHTPEGEDPQSNVDSPGAIPAMLISTCNGNCRFHRPASMGRSFSIFSQEGLGPPCNDFGDYVGIATVIGADGRVSVHPCRVRKGFQPTCFVPYNGVAIQHRGQFSLLCVTDDMEWVSASDGIIPSGRMPVEGGFEETGEKLYHALDTSSPSYAGKTAPHIGGAEFVHGGQSLELVKLKEYKILCWKT